MDAKESGFIGFDRFDRRFAEIVLDWVASPRELSNWTARTDFPLTDVTVFDGWHAEPDVAPYLLFAENGPVAYGEVWFDESEGSAELGRLIVSPRHRRRGLAKLLIERLISIARQAGYLEIWIRTDPANVAAFRCYQSAGFTRLADDEEAILNAAQRFPFLWMFRRETA